MMKLRTELDKGAALVARRRKRRKSRTKAQTFNRHDRALALHAALIDWHDVCRKAGIDVKRVPYDVKLAFLNERSDKLLAYAKAGLLPSRIYYHTEFGLFPQPIGRASDMTLADAIKYPHWGAKYQAPIQMKCYTKWTDEQKADHILHRRYKPTNDTDALSDKIVAPHTAFDGCRHNVIRWLEADIKDANYVAPMRPGSRRCKKCGQVFARNMTRRRHLCPTDPRVTREFSSKRASPKALDLYHSTLKTLQTIRKRIAPVTVSMLDVYHPVDAIRVTYRAMLTASALDAMIGALLVARENATPDNVILADDWSNCQARGTKRKRKTPCGKCDQCRYNDTRELMQGVSLALHADEERKREEYDSRLPIECRPRVTPKNPEYYQATN